MKCDGCGKEQACARCGAISKPVMLGYECGCLDAWFNSGLPWQDAAKWTEDRRKQVAS